MTFSEPTAGVVVLCQLSKVEANVRVTTIYLYAPHRMDHVVGKRRTLHDQACRVVRGVNSRTARRVVVSERRRDHVR